MAEWQSEFVVGEQHPRWAGGDNRLGYGVGWKPQRRQALERAGGVCEICRKNPVEDVHHKVPVRCFADPSDANFESNLVAVCKKCHAAAHKEINSTLLALLHFGS
jgi:5-methylcytosine-specific restriction endonuclease McrA